MAISISVTLAVIEIRSAVDTTVSKNPGSEVPSAKCDGRVMRARAGERRYAPKPRRPGGATKQPNKQHEDRPRYYNLS